MDLTAQTYVLRTFRAPRQTVIQLDTTGYDVLTEVTVTVEVE